MSIRVGLVILCFFPPILLCSLFLPIMLNHLTYYSYIMSHKITVQCIKLTSIYCIALQRKKYNLLEKLVVGDRKSYALLKVIITNYMHSNLQT